MNEKKKTVKSCNLGVCQFFVVDWMRKRERDREKTIKCKRERIKKANFDIKSLSRSQKSNN